MKDDLWARSRSGIPTWFWIAQGFSAVLALAVIATILIAAWKWILS